jgi:hypothetical protein
MNIGSKSSDVSKRSDAYKLVQLSGITDPELQEAIRVEIKTKNLIKRPMEKLVALLAHPCAQEQIERINSEYKKKYDRYVEEDALDEIGLDYQTNKQNLLKSVAGMTAPIIAEGFDIAFKDNLQINSETGQVVVKRDSTGQPDTRFLKCAAAELPPETPKSNVADPYKGSLQGLGRTRKHKRKAKKTLRRRKMRRNVH